MKILIHACKKRIEYVTDFLVPALVKSGYEYKDIIIYNDDKGEGCLKSYIRSFKELIPDDGGYTWHLQDDVLPRKAFYTHAEKALKDFLPGGIVCGYGNKEFYYIKDFGYAYDANSKFYSFPCIRIPNDIAKGFVTWFETRAVKNADLQKYIVNNKFVDYLFKIYLEEEDIYGKRWVFNYRPCLVDHVDEFCGGSTVNVGRKKPSKALDFNDKEALEELCNWYRKKEKR